MTTASKKRVAFRADASVAIGVGHIMRCLTLAHELRRRDCEVFFVCRDSQGPARALLEAQGVEHAFLSRDLDEAGDAEESAKLLTSKGIWDWVIVDNYALGAEWEKALHGISHHRMAIDDLANRAHDCELLLDQNWRGTGMNPYTDLVSTRCQLLLGSPYALLREEFRNARETLKTRGGREVKRILVSFGGTDSLNLTSRALQGIERLKRPGLAVDAVIGAGNPHRAKIERICEQTGAQLTVQASNMAERIAAADMAVGAAGSSIWEMACLGLPAVTLSTAANQDPVARGVDAAGVIDHIGLAHGTSTERLTEVMELLVVDGARRAEMERKGMELIDGRGAHRVADVLCGEAAS